MYDSRRPFVGWALWNVRSPVIDFSLKRLRLYNQGRDRVVLADDRRTVTLDLAAGSAVDQFRALVLSSSDEGMLE